MRIHGKREHFNAGGGGMKQKEMPQKSLCCDSPGFVSQKKDAQLRGGFFKLNQNAYEIQITSLIKMLLHCQVVPPPHTHTMGHNRGHLRQKHPCNKQAQDSLSKPEMFSISSSPRLTRVHICGHVEQVKGSFMVGVGSYGDWP